MYRNYIFDLYGTLVDIKTNEWKASLWKKMQEFYAFHGAEYTWKELKIRYEYLCSSMEQDMKEYDYPEIKVEYVFQKLFAEKGVDLSLENAGIVAQFFRVISTDYIKLYEGVIDVLKLLKSKGKKVYLLSNAQKVFTEKEFQMMGIAQYFDGVVYSSDEGCRKPSKSFFDIVLERYQLEKSESIMIGNDWITDIEGALEAGIDSLYIHTNISPANTVLEEVKANYIIEDGNFGKIPLLILKA